MINMNFDQAMLGHAVILFCVAMGLAFLTATLALIDAIHYRRATREIVFEGIFDDLPRLQKDDEIVVPVSFSVTQEIPIIVQSVAISPFTHQQTGRSRLRVAKRITAVVESPAQREL